MSIANFFILGNPRSGTSLLRSLLNAHNEVVVPPECGFALWLKDAWFSADFSSPNVQFEFLKAVQASRKFETWQLNMNELSAGLASRPVRNYADAVSRIYETYGLSRNKKVGIWGDKNNYYISQIPELRILFPEAKYVHIVRDVRDVACSYMELAKTNISSKYRPVLTVEPEGIAKEWMANNLAALDILEGSNIYLRIRYEDLVSNVEYTISNVWRFLGLVDSGSFSESAHLETLDEPEEFMQWKKKLNSPVDTSSVGRYKSELPAAATNVITTICRPLLERFGY